MKPNFALNLGHDGITLLHRSQGGWHTAGKVSLEDPEFNQKMGYLQQTAAALENGGVTTKLVIPNSQILFKTIDATGPDGPERHSQIRTALDGTTPYDIDDLAYDWCDQGGAISVVAVARETLAEAEAFAVEHGFNPVSFVATPENGRFQGEPYFGTSMAAKALLDAGQTVERDAEIINIIGPVLMPEKKAEKQPEPEPVKIKQAAEPAAKETSAQKAEAVKPLPDNPAQETDKPAALKLDSAEKPVDILSPAIPDPTSSTPDAPVFSSQRAGSTDTDTGTNAPSDAAAKRLEKTESRLAILPEGKLPLAPKLGGANRGSQNKKPAEPEKPAGIAPAKPAKPAVKPSPVTKPQTPPEILATAKTQVLNNPAPPRIAPDSTTDKPAKTTGFGALQMPEIPAKPRYLGLKLLLVLLAIFAIIIIWSSYFLNDATTFWRGNDAAEPVQTTAQTAAQQPDTIPDTTVGDALAMLTQPTITRPASLEKPDDAVDDIQADLEIEPEPVPESTMQPEVEMQAEPEAQIQTAEAQQLPAPPLNSDEAQNVYADTGIWQRAPDTPIEPAQDETRTLFMTSADPKIMWSDAIALPRSAEVLNAQSLENQASPAAQSTEFNLDERGLVTATAEGAMTPDGVLVYLGAPPIKPVLRGDRVPQVIIEPDLRLAAFRPQMRPADLIGQTQTVQLGGHSRAELAAFRPQPRPIAPKIKEEEAKEAQGTLSELAVVLSRTPPQRPGNFSREVARQVARVRASDAATLKMARPSAPVPKSQTIAPTGTTRASVAKLATVENALRLRRTSLIGVYGSPNKRRALVRLANGRYVKVTVGQRVDGGKVAAIGQSELRYVKGGRTIVLRMPDF